MKEQHHPYLVFFDRHGSVGSTVVQVDEGADPAACLFEAEARLRGSLDIGVVLLYAEDEASLRRTHGTFFLGFDEILSSARG